MTCPLAFYRKKIPPHYNRRLIDAQLVEFLEEDRISVGRRSCSRLAGILAHRQLVHRRPPQMEARRLLVSVSDGEQFGLAIEPAREGEGRRHLRVPAFLEAVRQH